MKDLIFSRDEIWSTFKLREGGEGKPNYRSLTLLVYFTDLQTHTDH